MASHFAGDVWSSFKRWNLKAIRNPFVVAFALIQPVIWLALFTQVFRATTLIPGFAADSYIAFFAPAVVIQASLFGATNSGISLVDDMRVGVFNKLLASPVNRGAMFLGKTLAETMRIVLQVLLIVGLAVVLGARVETGFLGLLAVVGVAVLFALGFAAFSNVIGLKTRSTEATIIISNFLALPLLFMSSAFLPVALLPDWLQTVSALNPVTYGIDATRALMLTGWDTEVIGRSVAVLAVFDLVTLGAAALLLRRATEAKAT